MITTIKSVKTGKYKEKRVTTYDTGLNFIIEFLNGKSRTITDVSKVQFDE